jgi:hypothetical protein
MLGRKPKSAPTTDHFKVPSLADAGGDVAALDAKRRELEARRGELEAERTRLWAAASAGPDEGDAAVAELLGDERDPGSPSRQTARARLTEIARESQAVAKALDVVGERIRAARGKASKVIREAVRPEYATRVAAVAKALSAAHAAHLSFNQLVEDLNAADVAWTLTPLSPHLLLGDPRDGHGAMARWFRDAQAAGYISATDIPEQLR